MFFSDRQKRQKKLNFYKKIIIYISVFLSIFLFIGLITSSQPAYRISSNIISKWTSDVDSTIFLNLIGMENRVFMHYYQEDNPFDSLSKTLFHLVTSVRPNDVRSLLGNELPGFSIYDNEILIAGEGTDYTTIPHESSFPLEDVLEERQAVYTEEDVIPSEERKAENDVVFIYNTHNRESYLPHLPGVTDPNLAHHSEVNITMVSERLKNELEDKGIGAIVDQTDIVGKVLVERNWKYGQSYRASREVVTEALAQHKDLKFTFDVHRDSIARNLTTSEINGESYARIMFVIGEENPSFERNYELAKNLHEGLEKKYPGLSRGVMRLGGAGKNGVYNQDLSENALLLEVGGVGNTLEETYRTAAAFAEIFSEYYWEAESVQGD